MKYAVPIGICLVFLAFAACSRTSPVPVSTQAQSPTATGQPTATSQPTVTPMPGLQTVEYLKRYSPNCGKPLPQSWPPGVTPQCPPTQTPTPLPPLWDSFEEFVAAVPGFGGYFIEIGEERVVNIYLLDPSQQEEAEQAARFLRLIGDLGPSMIRAAQGDYNWAQLEEWTLEAQKAVWLIPEVHSSGISHKHNRIEFGVTTSEGAKRAREALGETAVPGEAVLFNVSPKKADVRPIGFHTPTGIDISLEFERTIPAGQPISIKVTLTNGNLTRVEIDHRGPLREDLMIYTYDGDQISKKLGGVIVGNGETTGLQVEKPVTLLTVWHHREQNGTYLPPGQYLVRASVRYSPDIYGIVGLSHDSSDPYELTIVPGPLLPGRTCGPGIVDLPCAPGVETGKAYSFTLYTHCGIHRAYFDGRRWIIDPMFSNDNISPPPGWGNPIDEGMMELVAGDLARYTSESGMVAEFRPLPEGEEDVWSCD